MQRKQYSPKIAYSVVLSQCRFTANANRQTTSKVNGKCWTLTPKPPMNPLRDRH